MSLLRKHCLIFGRPNQSAFLQEEIKNETLYERAARVLRQFTSNFSFILDHIANYCCFFCFSNQCQPNRVSSFSSVNEYSYSDTVVCKKHNEHIPRDCSRHYWLAMKPLTGGSSYTDSCTTKKRPLFLQLTESLLNTPLFVMVLVHAPRMVDFPLLFGRFPFHYRYPVE